MATIMFRARCDLHPVSGSGTHVLPGHPMSVRTRTALSRLGLADPTHRSAQFDETDVKRAALIVAMAPEHVQWVRRVHPEAADRTVTLKRVVRDLVVGARSPTGCGPSNSPRSRSRSGKKWSTPRVGSSLSSTCARRRSTRSSISSSLCCELRAANYQSSSR